MNTTIIKSLGERFEESAGHITIGDADKCRQLEYIKSDDYALENMFISIYNLLNVHNVRLNQLESDIRTLVQRIYNTDENFADEEIEEIKQALDSMDLEMLGNVKSDADYLTDNLYSDIEDDESDFEERMKQQEALMNKIKFPTKAMHDTFNKLLADVIAFKESVEKEWEGYII